MTKLPIGIHRLSVELEQLDLNFDNTVIHSRLREFEKSVSDSGLSIKMGVKGTENYWIEGRHFALKPGHYLVVNRHQQFECQIRSQVPVEAICLYLSREIIAETYETLQGDPDLGLEGLSTPGGKFTFLEKLYRFEENELGRFLKGMEKVLLSPGHYHLDLPAFYYLLAEKLLRSQLQVDSRIDRISAVRRATREELYRRLSVAHQYILENFTNNLQLDQLSKVALLSKYHLLRTYKEVYGTTPYRQVLDLRLEKARTLLHRDLSLEEVAFQLGFSDRRSFAKAFRKQYGRAPSAFRITNNRSPITDH